MKNENWRLRIGKKRNEGELTWRIHLHKEFVDFANETSKLAELYDWDFWGGGVDNYAVTLSQSIKDGKSISICMKPLDKYKYYVSFARQWNPNNISSSEYNEFIGETMDDALKYLHTFLIDNRYQRDFKSYRICEMGGAYERYPLALKWAQEEMMETINQ